jgi:aminomuconate-semialdehyde/2-hydroxymuconate-6-semialdehyde dehydrogenase
MAMKDIPLFVGGEFLLGEGRKTFPDLHPATGEPFAEVVEATADDVDRAVQAAKKALKGPWGRMAQADRLALLKKVADGIMARFDDFLAAEVQDTGKPSSFARAVDIPRGAANFRIFAELAADPVTPAFQMDTADGKGAINLVTRDPLGVVGVICPWNLPLLLMTWKVAPALAMGNAVVVKPSEETPQTATLLGEVMQAVGIPAGVYNVVHGFGPGSTGQALVQHPDVAAITFTGESGTGSAIMKDAAPTLKHLSFELGGKNPAVIFEDADYDSALAGTLRSVFSNCGQVCLCSERVYVHRSLFDRFVRDLSERAAALAMGDPFDDKTGMGPLISHTHREKVLGYYALAKEAGAPFHTGGGTPDFDGPFSGGSFVQPTVISGLAEDSRIQREEIFGPICHVTPFDDEGEVVAMANNTEYGLCAAVWTQDLGRAHRVARAIEAGVVWVNAWFLRDLRTPFGGVKRSGIGREGGRCSLEFYSEVKNICIKL